MQNRDRMLSHTKLRSRSVAAAFAILTFFAVPARSQNNPTDVDINDRVNAEALQVSDYKKLMVVVMEIEPNPAKVTEEAVKAHTDMRVKAAGLTPGSDANDRFLLVSVHVEGAAFAIYIGFFRNASWELPGGKLAHNFLETWNAGDAVGTHGNSDALIMKELDARLESFLNAYLKANQPKK